VLLVEGRHTLRGESRMSALRLGSSGLHADRPSNPTQPAGPNRRVFVAKFR
jgi:hypothetical protein